MKNRFILFFTVLGVLAMTVSAYAQASVSVSVSSRQAQDRSFFDRIFAPDSAVLDFQTKHIVADLMNGSDAPETYRFEFSNRSFRKVKIERVLTTCSCLFAICDRKVIRPGETAVISVRFNPKGQEGKSERSIYVYTGKGNGPAAVLKLSTDVQNVMDVSGRYPISMGGINLSRNIIRFRKGEAAVETIRFVNVSGRSLKFDCDRSLLPDCLKFYAEPVRPLKEGVIKIAYDPSKGAPDDSMTVLLQGLGCAQGESSIKVIWE